MNASAADVSATNAVSNAFVDLENGSLQSSARKRRRRISTSSAETQSCDTDLIPDFVVHKEQVSLQESPPKRQKQISRSISSNSFAPSQNDPGKNPTKDNVYSSGLHVGLPPMRHPKCLYSGWESNVQELSEAQAIKYLTDDADTPDEVYITLTNFCIYRLSNDKYAAGTMAPLSDLKTQVHDGSLLFCGVLELGSKRCFVRNVPFEVMSIDGYDEEFCTVSDKIYVRSYGGARHGIWYHLSSQTASEYERFHREFLWLADFGKHFACYLLSHHAVRLSHFKRSFHNWLRVLYPNNSTLERWLAMYGQQDFRKVVANNPRYLGRESTNPGVDPDGRNSRHFIWKEVHPDLLGAIRKQPTQLFEKTTVTPYIYELFKNFYFADQLELKSPAPAVTAASDIIWSNYISMSLSPDVKSRAKPPENFDDSSEPRQRTAKIGDIVGIGRDDSGPWKDRSTIWYAYVHDIEIDKRDGRDFLHLLWLYRPQDTICANAHYPYSNELFMSDHCNCTCAKRSRIYSADVVEFPSVHFSARPIPEEEGYFIRQTYITQEFINQFVQLKPDHLSCKDRTGVLPSSAVDNLLQYKVGDTILITSRNKASSEPVEIVETGISDLRVRQLLRKERDCHIPSKANELVYTDLIESIKSSRIQRRCHIRFYKRAEVENNLVPRPYNLGGIADCWIVTAIFEHSTVKDITDSFKSSLREGFSPSPQNDTDAPPLRTMEVFIGGGFFGHGATCGGAARSEWGVDWDKAAIHTAHANSKNPENFFWGSAIRYMNLAMNGKFSAYVAAVGTVQLLLAGSPCQGFSTLQPNKLSERSRKNASMVTLSLSLIELYRPKYAVLENVYGMRASFGEKKDQQILAQMLCALVGMGYQTQAFLVDAYNYGDPQERSRIFICATAPGHEPPTPLYHTHANPFATSRSISTTNNGEKFGSRNRDEVAPFRFVSAAAATEDLPQIHDGAVDLCVRMPDHRLSRAVNWKKSAAINSLPRFPRGAGLVRAISQGKSPRSLLDFLRDPTKLWHEGATNKAYRRVDPDRLYTTILTACSFEDPRGGGSLHWNESRPMTIAEARRAQSIADDVVIIGSPSEQWKQIGNAVAGGVSTALGVSLRIAWYKTWEEKKQHFALLHPTGSVIEPDYIACDLALSQVEEDDSDIPDVAHETLTPDEALFTTSPANSDSSSIEDSIVVTELASNGVTIGTKYMTVHASSHTSSIEDSIVVTGLPSNGVIVGTQNMTSHTGTGLVQQRLSIFEALSTKSSLPPQGLIQLEDSVTSSTPGSSCHDSANSNPSDRFTTSPAISHTSIAEDSIVVTGLPSNGVTVGTKNITAYASTDLVAQRLAVLEEMSPNSSHLLQEVTQPKDSVLSSAPGSNCHDSANSKPLHPYTLVARDGLPPTSNGVDSLKHPVLTTNGTPNDLQTILGSKISPESIKAIHTESQYSKSILERNDFEIDVRKK